MFEFFQTHWKFIAASLLINSIMVFVKREAQRRSSTSKAWKLVRILLPICPIVIGMLIGLIPGLDSPLSESVGDDVLYFGSAGVTAGWVYSTVRHFITSLSRQD